MVYNEKKSFWRKSIYPSGKIYTMKSEEGKYADADIYLYNKGWFRGKENKYVVKIHYVMTPQKPDEIHSFNSLSDANLFINQSFKNIKTRDITKDKWINKKTGEVKG